MDKDKQVFDEWLMKEGNTLMIKCTDPDEVEQLFEKIRSEVTRLINKTKTKGSDANTKEVKAKVCPPGKELNIKTNRCNKIKVTKSKKKPKEQDKSTVKSTPAKSTPTKECPPGKELNPKTNRCIKVKSKKKPKKPKTPKAPETPETPETPEAPKAPKAPKKPINSETKLRDPLIEMLDRSWLDGYKHMEKHGRKNPKEQHWRPASSKLEEGERHMLDEVWDMGFQEYSEQARVNDFDEDAMPMWHHHVFKSPNSKPKDNWNLLPGDIKVNIMNINKEAEKKQYAKFYNIVDEIDPDNDGYYIDDKYDNDKHFINVINELKKTILKDLKLGDILFVGNSGEGEGGFIMYLDNDIYYDENGYSGPIRYVQNCMSGMGRNRKEDCEKMKTIRYSKLVMDLNDNNQGMYGLFGGDWLDLSDIKEQYEAVGIW